MSHENKKETKKSERKKRQKKATEIRKQLDSKILSSTNPGANAINISGLIV